MAPWLAVAICVLYPLVGLLVLWFIADRIGGELAEDAPPIVAFGFAVFWPLILLAILARYLADRFRGPPSPEE